MSPHTYPVVASPVWHPFTQHALMPDATPIVRTEGAYLETADGRRILDAISSWWVTTHGHRHPRIMQAIREASERYDQLIFAGFTHEPAEQLARRLIKMGPRDLAHVFFSDSGSTAVEVAIKMALGHWRNLGQRRHRIAVLEHGYHGDTIGTMSAGARGVFSAACEPLLFDVVRLPFPAAGREDATLLAFEEACRHGGLAALLIEPLVLGAGGMKMYGGDVLAALRGLCDAEGVLLIADEVMTGFGRTGRVWACSHAGIAPDILCIGKGLTGGALPLAATLATKPVFASHYSTDRSRTLFHSSSYTANPIACAAALANLDVWEAEPVRERIASLEGAQATRLARFADDKRFSSVRQQGTITALDVAVGDAGYLADIGPRLYAHALARDVLLRPLGNTLYVLPPYCTTPEELDRIYTAIDSAADLARSGA